MLYGVRLVGEGGGGRERPKKVGVVGVNNGDRVLFILLKRKQQDCSCPDSG